MYSNGIFLENTALVCDSMYSDLYCTAGKPDVHESNCLVSGWRCFGENRTKSGAGMYPDDSAGDGSNGGSARRNFCKCESDISNFANL